MMLFSLLRWSSIDEDHCEFEESADKESERYSGEDFNIID